MLRGAREGWDGQRAVGVRGAGAGARARARARGCGHGQRRASLGCGDGALGMSDTHVAQAVDVRVRDFDAVAFLLDIGTLWGEAHARARSLARGTIGSAEQVRVVAASGMGRGRARARRMWNAHLDRVGRLVLAHHSSCAGACWCLRRHDKLWAERRSVAESGCRRQYLTRLHAHFYVTEIRQFREESDQSLEARNIETRLHGRLRLWLARSCWPLQVRVRAGPIHVRWAH